MLRERIKFPDLNGKEVEEDFDFNITAAEVALMDVKYKGGLKEYFDKVLQANDRAAIVDLFNEILLMSVGRRSEDNRRFLKTDEIRNDFRFSGAYEHMFFKLMSDDAYAVHFVNNVFPKDAVEKMNSGMPISVNLPTTPVAVPTPNLSADPQKDFQDYLAWKKQNEHPLGLGQ